MSRSKARREIAEIRQAAHDIRDHWTGKTDPATPFYLAVADLLDLWVDADLHESAFSLPEELWAVLAIARAYPREEQT